MEIIQENFDATTAILRVKLAEEDYKPLVDKQLKDLRKKIQVPGFRPGRVPMGRVKAMYGHALLVEEVSKMASEKAIEYLTAEKIKFFGQPLPSPATAIDFDTQKDFEFVFDVGISPQIEYPVSADDTFTYYAINADAEMIDEEIEQSLSHFSEEVETEQVNENSILRGVFRQIDEAGDVVEAGVLTEDAIFVMKKVADAEVKEKLLAAKVGDSLNFFPARVFENLTDMAAMLGIDVDNEEFMNSEYTFSLEKITEFKKPEINEALFEKLGNGIDSEEAWHNKIRENISKEFERYSLDLFTQDVIEFYGEKVKVELPEMFLSRWIDLNKEEDSEPVTEESLANTFSYLKRTEVRSAILAKHDVKVTEEELKTELIIALKTQYGAYATDPKFVEMMMEHVLKNENEKGKYTDTILNRKMAEIVKAEANIQIKEITFGELNAILNVKNAQANEELEELEELEETEEDGIEDATIIEEETTENTEA